MRIYRTKLEEAQKPEVDFDALDDVIYLNYTLPGQDWRLQLEAYKEDINVQSHFERGDYDSSSAGGLNPGWYGRGHEIDDVSIPFDRIHVHCFNSNEEEITELKLRELAGLSEEQFAAIVKDAKERLVWEADYYVSENIDEFV